MTLIIHQISISALLVSLKSRRRTNQVLFPDAKSCSLTKSYWTRRIKKEPTCCTVCDCPALLKNSLIKSNTWHTSFLGLPPTSTIQLPRSVPFSFCMTTWVQKKCININNLALFRIICHSEGVFTSSNNTEGNNADTRLYHKRIISQ